MQEVRGMERIILIYLTLKLILMQEYVNKLDVNIFFFFTDMFRVEQICISAFDRFFWHSWNILFEYNH